MTILNLAPVAETDELLSVLNLKQIPRQILTRDVEPGAKSSYFPLTDGNGECYLKAKFDVS